MQNKFFNEMQGSVSHRQYRYDTQAASESSHQSKSDYIRRKEGVNSKPSWSRYASTSVPDFDEVAKKSLPNRVGSAAANNNNNNTSASSISSAAPVTAAANRMDSNAVALVSTSATVFKRRVEQPRVISPLRCRNISPSPGADASASNQEKKKQIERVADSRPIEGKTIMFTHHGIEHVSKPTSSTQREGDHSSSSSSSSVYPKVQVLTGPTPKITGANKIRRQGKGDQPCSIGDILGKSLNITHTQQQQRERYENLEHMRLNSMKHDLIDHGWEPENKTLGRVEKTFGRRIYAGLPTALEPEAEKIYRDLKEHRQKSPTRRTPAD